MKIINIVGKSGSGKSYWVDLIKLVGDINVIESFTTREPRYDGEDGHIFIKDMQQITSWDGYIFRYKIGDYYHSVYEREVVAHQSLYDADYFATDNQFKKNRINVFVVDEVGAKKVTEYYRHDKNVEIVNILLLVEDYILKDRLFSRELNNSKTFDWLDKKVADRVVDTRFKKDRLLKFDKDFYDLIVDNSRLQDHEIMDIWDRYFNEK